MIALPPEQQTPHLRRVGSNAAPVPCTAEELRELLDYDPETGKLTWKPRSPGKFTRPRAVRRFNQRFAGREALTAPIRGGLQMGTILTKTVYAHRVAFAIHHGRWPKGEVLHRDGDRRNNRANNLVEASTSVANILKAPSRSNTAGATGIHFIARLGKWSAHIRMARKQHRLGCFDTRGEAIAARQAAEERLGLTDNRKAHRGA